jgi:hypothetical protein
MPATRKKSVLSRKRRLRNSSTLRASSANWSLVVCPYLKERCFKCQAERFIKVLPRFRSFELLRSEPPMKPRRSAWRTVMLLGVFASISNGDSPLQLGSRCHTWRFGI